MNIDDFNKLADGVFIAKHQAEIGQIDHTAYSSVIYTDGEYSTKVNANTGYITISNIVNATYLIYLDMNQKVILYIYENILKTTLKHVYDELAAIRSAIVPHVEDESPEDKDKPDNIDDHTVGIDNVTYREFKDDRNIRQTLLHFNGLIDINDMVCDTCGSTEFKGPMICDDKITLEYQCIKCNTIFRLIPSRYFVVDSKTVFMDSANMLPNNKSLHILSNKSINVKVPKTEESSPVASSGEYVDD